MFNMLTIQEGGFYYQSCKGLFRCFVFYIADTSELASYPWCVQTVFHMYQTNNLNATDMKMKSYGVMVRLHSTHKKQGIYKSSVIEYG